MSPYDDLRRRSSGEDSIEQEGVAARRSAGAGEGGRTAGERCGGADESELPAGQAAVEALPGGRRGEAEARQCGASVQPRRGRRKSARRSCGRCRKNTAGFGPTLAAEHLASEDQLEVHPETLRRWMLAEGLWSEARKRKQHRKRRDRRAHFGELVQMDGSFHDWYRGPRRKAA